MRHTIPLISLINIRNYVVATHRRVMHVVTQISARNGYLHANHFLSLQGV